MRDGIGGAAQGDGLADILERVLDKGVVVAGDVTVAVGGVELLTIKLRLLVTTVDKAVELGIDWWRRDPALSALTEEGSLAAENAALRGRLAILERRLEQIETVRLPV